MGCFNRLIELKQLRHMRFFPKVLIFITACNEKRQAHSSCSPFFWEGCATDYVVQSFKKSFVVISQQSLV